MRGGFRLALIKRFAELGMDSTPPLSKGDKVPYWLWGCTTMDEAMERSQENADKDIDQGEKRIYTLLSMVRELHPPRVAHLVSVLERRLFADRAHGASAPACGSSDVVAMSTIHSSKGLNFGAAAMLSLSETLVNALARIEPLPVDLHEELATLFVGLTRARDVLIVPRGLDELLDRAISRVVRGGGVLECAVCGQAGGDGVFSLETKAGRVCGNCCGVHAGVRRAAPLHTRLLEALSTAEAAGGEAE